MKWLLITLLIVTAVFLIWGCSSHRKPASQSTNTLHIVFDNTCKQTLWVDISAGNTKIDPMFSSIKAGATIDVTLTPDIFGSTSAGFNFYDSPAKFSKKAIVVVRDSQVYLRQCKNCKVEQSDQFHAKVTLAD